MSTTGRKTSHSGNGARARPAAPTTDKLRETSHEFVDDVADRAESVEEKVRTQSARASEQMHEQKEAVADQVQASRGQIERFIKDRPLAAAGIAFAAGVFASRMMGR